MKMEFRKYNSLKTESKPLSQKSMKKTTKN